MLIYSEINTDAIPKASQFIETVLLGRGAKIINSKLEGNLNIGDYTCINRSSLLQGVGTGAFSYIADSLVGPFSMIGSRVSIGGFNHPKNWLSTAAFQWGQSMELWDVPEHIKIHLRANTKPTSPETVIKPDSWIGDNAVVLSGRQIGIGSIIGAGSVVTTDIEDYAIAVGNPARVIDFRFSPQIREFLVKSKWWCLPFEQISQLTFSNVNKAIEQLSEIMD
jgi:acetyltransferase-like isoleucine patch superfamily enzyme